MESHAPVHVAILGLRGMNPHRELGGFETAFSRIAPALVRRGLQVTVYCRAGVYDEDRRPAFDESVRLIYVPSWGGKNFAGVVATAFAVLHALVVSRPDVYFFVNVGMGMHCALAKLSRRPVVLNVDGLDWLRGKWGAFARWYFRTAARVATRVCDVLVTDATAMRRYYLEHFHRDSTVIAYGADVADVADTGDAAAIRPLGLEPRGYYLVVSRIVPENSLEMLLNAYRRLDSAKPLVLVGQINEEYPFHRRLVSLMTPNVIQLGEVTDQALLGDLWANAYVYLHGHSVGGTNPALVRAMGAGAATAALDTVFNRETLDDAGMFFTSAEDLTAHLAAAERGEIDLDQLRAASKDRARSAYSWNDVIDRYESLFRQAATVGTSRNATAGAEQAS